MRFLLDQDIIVTVDDRYMRSEKLSLDAPVTSYLNNHRYLREVAKCTGCMKAIAQYFNQLEPIHSVVDMMAGCGFGTSIYNKYLQPHTVTLNDMSPDCVHIWKDNWQNIAPNVYFSNMDTNQYQFNPTDLYAVDFNTFSIKHIAKWESLFQGMTSTGKYINFTDTACFGFKFGQKNFKTYDVSSEEEYYSLLSKTFYQYYGFSVIAISRFSNAANVLLTKQSPENIHWLTPATMSIQPIKHGLLS